MIRYLISTTILMSTLPVFAAKTVCKASLAKPKATVALTPEAELDALFSELDGGPQSKPDVKSKTVAKKQKVGAPEFVNRDPKTLSVQELLISLNLEPYEARIAIAELLRQEELGDGKLAIREEIGSLFQGILDNDLSTVQKLNFEKFKTKIAGIITQSKSVQRFRIIAQAEAEADAKDLENQDSMADMYTSITSSVVPPKPLGFFKSLFAGNKNTEQTGPVYRQIPYENPVQYARALLERPSAERIEIIRQQARTMGFISHLEAYRILLAIPTESHVKVYGMLKPNLIGRIDFYPLSVLQSAADINSMAGIFENPIDPKVILNDLRETGTDLDTFEVYDFLKNLNFKSSDISTALVGRALTLEQLTSFSASRGHSIPFDDMLTFTRIFIHSSPDIGTIEEGRKYLKTLFPDPDLTSAIDHFFEREIRETNFRVQQMLANIRPENLSPQELYERILLMVEELQFLRPNEALGLLQLIPSEVVAPDFTRDWETMEKKNIDFFLPLRAGIRKTADTAHEIHNTNDKEWTASDLLYLNVSKNLELAHRILIKVKGTMTEDVRAQMGTEVQRQISRSQLYEPNPTELNPLKPKMRPMRVRGVSSAILKEYLLGLLIHI